MNNDDREKGAALKQIEVRAAGATAIARGSIHMLNTLERGSLDLKKKSCIL